ncbi:MAG: transporter substrate-binding domain-containing protein [Desulfarculus sp.]|nr:transporter substrate-binding domain-containing protein [Desulfarculus sp.]
MRKTIFFFLVILWASGVGQAWAEPPDQRRTLVVGTTLLEPFVMKNRDGVYRGLALDLWAAVAQDLGLDYKLVELDLADLLNAVKTGGVDVAVGPITVTSAREKEMDFSHPYFHTGLTLAVRNHLVQGWRETFKHLFSSRPMLVLLAVLVGLVLMGALVWLAERRANRQQFGDGMRGVGHSLWWAAQTLSSVGYGDKTPITLPGRVLAFVWMMISLVLVSLFTAVITTALTVNHLNQVVRGIQDLVDVRVGTVAASSSETFLAKHRVDFARYPGPRDGLKALNRGDIDAFVFDAPILQYIIKHEMTDGIRVIGKTFDPQDYAFALPNQSPWRKAINTALLRAIHGEPWRDAIYLYLGDDAVPQAPMAEP